MADWVKRLGDTGNRVWKKGKDALVSSALAGFILNRTRLQRYGRLQALQLDSFEKEISFSLQPAGEEEFIAVKASYQILAEEKIKITRLQISRQWLQVLAQQYLLEHSFTVPRELFLLLK